MTKMIDYLDKLKPAQKAFLVGQVGLYREGFHHGLLPFLEVAEAKRTLLRCIEGVKDNPLLANNVRFAKQIISLLGPDDYKLCKGEVSVMVELNSMKMAKKMGRRFSHSFCFVLGGSIAKGTDGLVHVEKTRQKNLWKLTAHPADLEKIQGWVNHWMFLK